MSRSDAVAAGWRKSSHSGGGEGGSNCVQVAAARGRVLVGDSKRPGQRPLDVPAAGWRAFTDSLRQRPA